MTLDSDTDLTHTESSYVCRIANPAVFLKAPIIAGIELIPADVLNVMQGVWSQDKRVLDDVFIREFRNVFVAAEGLVFTQEGALVTNCRGVHSDFDVQESRAKVSEAIISKNFQIEDRAILTKARGAENFGHFLIEMLPRAWLAKRELGLDDWSLVSHRSGHIFESFVADALEFAGFDRNRVLFTGREPVFYKRLITVENLTCHTVYISTHVMDCMEAISRSIEAAKEKNIFVPRRPAVSREFLDYSTISAAMAKEGFAEIITGEMPFRDQIAAFKGANFVVAALGAAATNIAFCRPGTNVIMFAPASAVECFYWMLAEARHLNYIEIRCPEFGPVTGGLPWDRKIDVQTADVIHAIRWLKNNAAYRPSFC